MINDVNQLVEALGGTLAVSRLCGVVPSAVSNWRKSGRIPADKYMIFKAAVRRLRKRGPDPALFEFAEPIWEVA